MQIKQVLYKSLLPGLALIGNMLIARAQPHLEWVQTTNGLLSNYYGGGYFGWNGGGRNSIAVDSSGNVYTCGFFYNTVDFDPDTGTYNMTAAGQGSLFVRKLNVSGAFVWAEQWPGNFVTSDVGGSIALDASGNIYISSIFSGTQDFDPGPNVLNLTAAAAGYDIFIAKLNPSGGLIWVKQMPGGDYASIGAIAVDTGGGVCIAGSFGGTIDFNPGIGAADTFNLHAATGVGADAFITRLDASGNFIWARQAKGDSSVAYPFGVVLDHNNNVYVSGPFFSVGGHIDFNTDTGVADTLLFSSDYSALFMVKLDNDGNFLWAKRVQGDTSSVWSGALAMDDFSNLYITGSFYGTIDFDPAPGLAGVYPMSSTDTESNCFILKISTDGTLVWARQFAGISYSEAIAVDPIGNNYTTGTFMGTVDFDPGPAVFNRTSTGLGHDMFLTMLSPTGDLLWTGQIEGDGPTMGNGVAIDQSHNIYTIGDFTTRADLDPGPDTALRFTATMGGTDYFVEKLRCGVFDTITVTSCNDFTSHGQTYTATGIYVQTLTDITGCDTVLTVDLIIHPLDTSVTVNGPVLMANNSSATFYQWINCVDGSLIPGATGQSFTAAANGSYAVVIGNNGCSDTSSCFTVNVTGIDDIRGKDLMEITPNPAEGVVKIATEYPLKNATISLRDISGRVVMERTGVGGSYCLLDIAGFAPGIYEIEIRDSGKVLRSKLVKK